MAYNPMAQGGYFANRQPMTMMSQTQSPQLYRPATQPAPQQFQSQRSPPMQQYQQRPPQQMMPQYRPAVQQAPQQYQPQRMPQQYGFQQGGMSQFIPQMPQQGGYGQQPQRMPQQWGQPAQQSPTNYRPQMTMMGQTPQPAQQQAQQPPQPAQQSAGNLSQEQLKAAGWSANDASQAVSPGSSVTKGEVLSNNLKYDTPGWDNSRFEQVLQQAKTNPQMAQYMQANQAIFDKYQAGRTAGIR